MAQKLIYIGDIGPFIYDDAVTPKAISVQGRIESDTAPTGSNDVLRLADVGAGGVAAPIDAQYLVLALDGDLTNERSLTVDGNLELSDGGAGAAATLKIGSLVSIDNTDSPYTVGATTLTVLADTTSGDITINLPSSILNKHLHIVNTGTGTVTVDANGSEEISGSVTQSLSQYEALHLVGDGTGWWIL